ncbi:cell wall-binding repeat-containing protein [Peptostreptococcus stomatis]
MKKTRNMIAFVGMSAIMTLMSAGQIFAADFTKDNSLTSLIQIEGGNATYVSPSKVIKDTYWADLEEGTVINRANKKYYGVFPKYVLKPNESALADLELVSTYPEGSRPFFPSTGITESEEGMKIIDLEKFYRLGFLLGGDAPGPENAGDPIPESKNPFGFKEEDLLSQEEIQDPTKLNVLADINQKGSSNSSKMGEYKAGDPLNLDFSMNASWFKRFVMGYTLYRTRGDYMSNESIWEFYERMDGKLDSQIVYTLDIPEGVEVKNPSATMTSIGGVDYFDLETKVKEESGRKKLVLSFRLKEAKRDNVEPWQDTIEKIKKIDTSNIKVSISGLSVSSTAKPGDKITLKGTVSGYFEWALSKNFRPLPRANKTKIKSVLKRAADTDVRHIYLTFVGKQNNDGRDQEAPSDKPNLISYTFKVKNDSNDPFDPGTIPDPGKVDGDDRIETGINISKKFYGKAKTVIVVRHDLFPDSMTSSVLAKLKDAPILLNPTDRLDPRVGTEIKRLGAEEVIIVGGPDSISERVREALKAYDKDNNVERVAGSDRYGTSEMVAKRVAGITGKKNVGVVASGQVFPDALSAGTFASRDGYPILLVKKDSMPDQIVRAINDLNIKNTYIAGGINTVSKSVEAKLPGVLERMAGKNRYETSVAIAKSKFKDSKKAFVASGEEFADALVISPVSGMYNRPTLLASRNKNNNTVVKKYIHEAGLISITGIGGEKYLPYSILLDLVGK